MKSKRFCVIGFMVSIFMCGAISAQRPSSQQKQRAKTDAREREQRTLDEEVIRNMEDPGADVSFVVSIRANIRSEPNRASAVLMEVERGEVLALLEREPNGTWYHVIHVKSAIEGWIDQSVVINKLTANRYNAPEFLDEETVVYENPKVRITNRELNTDLNLKINDILYVIKANTSRTIVLSPGHYEYYGWSPGVRATIGKHDLIKGHIYSWSFFIRRT